MHADVEGALAQINTSWKAFEHKGKKMSKVQVIAVLEYAKQVGYKTTDQIPDRDIDEILYKINNMDYKFSNMFENIMGKIEENKSNISGQKYINDPKTIIDFENNAKFQFNNVTGWMNSNNYESALIKARYFVEDLEKLVHNSSL